MALRQRRTGAEGDEEPKDLKMLDWRARKADEDFCSDSWLRATVMSTMDPEVMLGGRSMLGNSIWGLVSLNLMRGRRGSHKAFILREENGHAGIDFAYCE